VKPKWTGFAALAKGGRLPEVGEVADVHEVPDPTPAQAEILRAVFPPKQKQAE
jgi:hypothetical protein